MFDLCCDKLFHCCDSKFFSEFVGVCLFGVGVPSLERVEYFFVGDFSSMVLLEECCEFLLDLSFVSR